MKKKTLLIPAVLAMTLVMSPAAHADEIENGAAEYDKAIEYFSEYYNIDAENTGESANEILAALGGETIEVGEDGSFDENDVIIAGLRLAGLEELALSYVNEGAPDKAKEKLEAASEIIEGYGVDVTDEFAPYIACALDLNLVGPEGAQDVPDFLYRCAEIAGMGRHYVGRVSDPDILSAVRAAMDSFINFDEEELTNLGTEIVLQGATTGYNLKYSGYDAHFLADYTIKYGHSDYQHAQQLIGLLLSEGVDAYIQIEPKVSAYEYMIEWGDPGDPTPTYAVKQVTEDRYVCYATEYDMLLEFDTVEDKEAFDGLIETYAKKYDDRVDEDGNVTAALLAGSWWQPLYSSTTPMDEEAYGKLVDNIVYDESGLFSIHPFSLPENTEAIAKVVEEVAPELTVSPQTIYVNAAFMRYITGEDYQ